MPEVRFTEKKILIRPYLEMIVNLSSSDVEMILDFSNTFMGLKGKVFEWQMGLNVAVNVLT